MQNDASTYRDMYEGPVVFGDGSADSDNVYWYGGVAYEITMTHKQALDKPTVTCRIPAALLSVETPSAAAADFLLRAFLPYADELNAELYNRSRTERENGAYLLPRPGSEVLVRNAAFFAVCPQKYYENGSANMIYPLPADGRRQLSPAALLLPADAGAASAAQAAQVNPDALPRPAASRTAFCRFARHRRAAKRPCAGRETAPHPRVAENERLLRLHRQRQHSAPRQGNGRAAARTPSLPLDAGGRARGLRRARGWPSDAA